MNKIHHTYPIPGLAVALVDAQGVNFFYEGVADNKRTSFTDTTVFYSGNISELLVATTILRLVDADKISLDDPIIKHLPYFKLGGNTYRGVTIRHMLTHASGIPHHDVIFDPPSYDDHALETTTRSIEHQQPDFPFGTKIKRSPYNYDILADLVAKVTGDSFESYARKNVLIPLGMKHSSFSVRDLSSHKLAQPFHISNWLSYDLKQSDMYPYSREHAGSRGLHTTLHDISRWLKMILNNGVLEKKQFLQEKSIREFFKRAYQIDANHFTGMGWEIEHAEEKTFFSKGENAYGFTSNLTILPEERVGVITISNISGDFEANFVNQAILNLTLNRLLLQVKIPVSIQFSKTVAATGSLDSAFAWYEIIETQRDVYAISEEELSQPGVNLLYRLNRPADAIRVFEFCLEHFPDSPNVYLNIAEAQLIQQDLQKAAQALAKAKDLNPKHPDLLARIAFVEERLKVGEENALLSSRARP
ncbi:serine hydrolase [Pseudochryseolinea flava]|uniref:serine hydrolase n=1 Tax=Pseudochryseolinea flava TaxID=2059302 RepID=UPI0014039D09|nr:serine hydrolase [Pseudochryseolinea flava]